MFVPQFLWIEKVTQDHPLVKLNNLDNLKSIDSAICAFSVIALTPISVNGLVHLNLDGLSRCYLVTAVEEEILLMVISKPLDDDCSDGETLRAFNVPVCNF